MTLYSFAMLILDDKTMNDSKSAWEWKDDVNFHFMFLIFSFCFTHPVVVSVYRKHIAKRNLHNLISVLFYLCTTHVWGIFFSSSFVFDWILAFIGGKFRELLGDIFRLNQRCWQKLTDCQITNVELIRFFT